MAYGLHRFVQTEEDLDEINIFLASESLSNVVALPRLRSGWRLESVGRVRVAVHLIASESRNPY